MLLRRTIKFLFSSTPAYNAQLLKRSQTLQQQIKAQSEEMAKLKESLANEEKKLNIRNQEIQSLRLQLTNEVKKGDEIREKAKNTSQMLKRESIQNFAKGIAEFQQTLTEIKKQENQSHDSDLKEGFDLTYRLFYSILEKYKIVKYTPEVGSAYKKQDMEVVKEIANEDSKKKGAVAQIVESGWEAEGLIIKKAKVNLYL